MAIIAWMVKNRKLSLVLLVAGLLANCSIVQKPLKIKDDMAGYGESIYKRQNLATQQFILLEEDMSLEEQQRLSEAELQMYNACRFLNEAASREMEGKKISIYFQGLVRSSLKACDDSVKNMELMLKNTVLQRIN